MTLLFLKIVFFNNIKYFSSTPKELLNTSVWGIVTVGMYKIA